MSVPVASRALLAQWRAEMARNFVAADPHLTSLLRLYGYELELESFGALCAGPIHTWAVTTNRDEYLPQLRRYDGLGNRVESVEFHPDYHAIGRAIYGTGLMGRYATPGREVETLSFVYLLSQNGEAGHCCPLACTAGLIKILQSAKDPGGWLEGLYNPDYDRHYHGAQFLTEIQGGSDVGANALVAKQGPEGWTLHGEKWFCSVVDAHLFLVTARPEHAGAGTSGLMAFVVPRTLSDGSTNQFRIRRLKSKLGTRSMASAELDFEGTHAIPVGDFRKVVEIVLNTSRVYNATCAAGFLQRAWREAWSWATHRTAFGQPIRRFPIIARVLADLRAEAYGARASTFLAAALSDQLATGRIGGGAYDAWRMLVNLNKIWTAWTCPAGIRSAIEVMGGNGAIEDFSVLPRLLRDSIVLEAWEGGHGVLCAQILRDARQRRLHEPFFAFLESRAVAAVQPALQQARARWERVLALPDAEAAGAIRPVVEELRAVVQALALYAESVLPGSDPLTATAAAHLLTIHARGYDPLDDAGLSARVEALNQES